MFDWPMFGLRAEVPPQAELYLSKHIGLLPVHLFYFNLPNVKDHHSFTVEMVMSLTVDSICFAFPLLTPLFLNPLFPVHAMFPES